MTRAPTSPDPFDGTPYRALRSLGERATSRLYLVEHRETDRRLAAKVLQEGYADDPQWVDRLRLEAQALGRLDHPHIVSILEIGATRAGKPFIVTEFLPGVSLAEELKQRGPLPLLEAIAFGWQLMAALAAAHRLGLVHRDVNPSNLFLCDQADSARILKVLDFGLARVLPGSADAPARLELPTREDIILGTPDYASPEVLRGQAADPRSDIYAAGLVIYRMLAGRGPFDDARNHEELLQRQLRSAPPPASHLAHRPLPVELDRLILATLADDPGQRLQTADEACAALEEIGQALVGPPGWAETVAFDQDPLARADTATGSAPIPAESEARSAELPAAARPLPPSRSALAMWFLLLVLVVVMLTHTLAG